MSSFFFFNDTATTEIYTLSLHDALPISLDGALVSIRRFGARPLMIKDLIEKKSILPEMVEFISIRSLIIKGRSEEHTSELQSQSNLVCRLLLEKKKK